MSILTKISVVVLVLLILLSAPVFIRQATVPINWKNQATELEKRIKVMTMQAQHAALVAEGSNKENDRLSRELQNLIATSAADKTRLRDELTDLQGKLADEGNERKKQMAVLADLQGNLALESKQRTLLQDQLNTVEKEKGLLETKSRRLEEQTKEYQAQLELAGKVSATLREQIAELNERIKNLETQIASGGPVGGALPVIGVGAAGGGEGARAEPNLPDVAPQIDGTVTTVRGDLAGINLGSAKGMRPGMKLIVFRGSEFVGYLRVQEVGVDQSAGTLFEQRTGVKQGDKVTTNLLRKQ
ncbi:MAG: hypothetical protein ABFD92_19640 [Planctomycetaceae bacterium]|nr:hypothetical protein [Planctomycetaceae bacterium]